MKRQNTYYRAWRLKPKALILLLLCLAAGVSLSAQETSFAIPGSRWLYKNEGKDTSIKYISIRRDGEKAWYVKDIGWKECMRMRRQLLREDSTVAKTDYFYLDTTMVGTPRLLLVDYIDTSIWKGTDTTYWFNLYAFNFRGTFSTWVPLHGYHNFNYDKNPDTIHVGGHSLLVGYSNLLFQSDSCINFCGPIVERAGNLGYFFGTLLCDADTFYAGHLQWYFDPEIGRWNVPDSLKSDCRFQQYATIANFEHSQAFLLYPNPAQNVLHVSWGHDEARTLTIISLEGRTVYEESILGRAVAIAAGNLTPGLYFLCVRSKEGITMQKFIKSN